MAAFLAFVVFFCAAFAQEPAAAPAAEAPPTADAKPEGEAEGEGEAAAGEAVVYPKPERVKVGVYINDVQSINLKDHSYALDAYIWFRWRDPDVNPAATMEFINPSELWGHMLTPVYEEPEELENGERYQVVRVQGRFSRKMPLYNYPFDRQQLVMMFEDTTHEVANLVYEVDTDGLSLNPALVLPGYKLGESTLVMSEASYPTKFGDTRLEKASQYTRATVTLPITRPAVPYGIKLLVPVLAVITCAALMFLLAPTYVDSRVDVGITSLLTIVALQMTFNQDLPDVGYLMLMDKVYLASYLFVIAGLGVVVRTTRVLGTPEETTAMSLHHRALVALASLYLLSVAWMVWSALAEG